MIIADRSGLLALYNRNEPAFPAVSDAIGASSEPVVVSPFVIPELDYVAATRLGVDAELAIIRELAQLTADEVETCADVVERYRDQEIGITDASLVVLAHRYRTRTVVTLDRRHFDVLRPLDGGRFTLLPA